MVIGDELDVATLTQSLRKKPKYASLLIVEEVQSGRPNPTPNPNPTLSTMAYLRVKLTGLLHYVKMVLALTASSIINNEEQT